MDSDRVNQQLIIEIFDRLSKFGHESSRPLFCQRLQKIWEEQSICCQTYPTITNQLLDLYKLHDLVQEKQGYLEITTNRGWKEISNVLGFGDSGSAAYSVKRNYVRLGLLAYECQYDRAGIDPRSVIELSEMPHTVKKRKRTSSTSTTRWNTKNNNKQILLPMNSIIENPINECRKLSDNVDLIKYSSNYENLSSRIRLTPQQMPIHDIQQLSYNLRAGYLADSNKSLDTILVWLSDSRTASYFNLKTLPGLLNAIMEQYIACLYELFDKSFIEETSINDSYVKWFLKLNFKLNNNITGPRTNFNFREELFYGKYRYLIKNKQNEDIDRFHSIIIRCSCLTTIIRNLSFIEENEYLANDRCLIDILQRILNCQHEKLHDSFNEQINFDQQYNEQCSFCVANEFVNQLKMFSEHRVKDFQQSYSFHNDSIEKHSIELLDNTFITLSNLSTSIQLDRYYPLTRYKLVNTIVHWILCSLSLANQKFISMIKEDKYSIGTNEIHKDNFIYISPRQISLQILAKICTNEVNVDFILIDLNLKQLKSLCHGLISFMNTINHNDIDREYSLLIICSLCKRNRQIMEFFSMHNHFINLIFNYLDSYEYNQQQYLIETITSLSKQTNVSYNHSNDMLIDSCIQILLLIAKIKENNCLKSYEYKLVDMSSSIYFEQQILKAFADILYMIS